MTIDEFSLLLADRLCHMVVTDYPQFGCIPDEQFDLDAASGLPIQVLDGAHADRAFRVLLSRELAFERQLMERGQVTDMPAGYGFAFQADSDGNIECVTDTVVQNGEPTLFIPFDAPTVRGLVTACIERPVCDLVRVFSYLVRVECELVGPLSNIVCMRGETIACVRETVSILRMLVGRARLEQGCDAEREADDPEDDADDVRRIHETDSTER